MRRKVQSKPQDKTAAIIDAALALASAGGFDNVRQRDVAARAGVTLRTLYRKFPNKHALLAAGMERSIEELHRRLAERPIRARKPSARIAHLFDEMTAVICDEANLGRAVVRALVSGTNATAEPALRHFTPVFALVRQTLRGSSEQGETSVLDNERAMLLLQVWFAALVSWLAGMVDVAGIRVLMEIAIRHVIP